MGRIGIMHKFAKRWRIGDFAWCEVWVSHVYFCHNSVVHIALVVSATMLTFFLIMVKLSLYNFIRSHIQNIKELKRRCAHGVCRSSAGKEDCERLDRSVAVMADIAVFPENFGKYPNCICWCNGKIKLFLFPVLEAILAGKEMLWNWDPLTRSWK